MKILHVCQNYYPSKGGPQYTMKHVSEKLVEYYGDEVSVCTTNSLFVPESKLFQKITPAYEIINGVKVNRLPFNRWHYPLIKFTNKALIKSTGLKLPERIGTLPYTLDSPGINNMMARAEADVIMATTIGYNFCNYPIWRFKKGKPKPFVLYGAIHLHKKIDNANDPSLLKARACDCYIANTEFERNEMIGYGVKPYKIVNIGTGINIPAFAANNEDITSFKKKHDIKPTDIVIGFIGRLVKGKGVAILIDAFRNLFKENKNAKLLLAGGTTDYVASVKKIIQEEKLPIILIEDFDDSMKPVLYHSLDIFVLASQSESFGVVLLEAWACKKPVIATSMGATASLVADGHDGLLFSAGDVDDLLQKIGILANNENYRQTLGEYGYQKAFANYSWPAIVKKYRDAYMLGIENFKQEYNFI
ncbi:MAG TPA: glycosyltransferase family 4 protein [Chitinophagaceae bacterium]|nr:glycosyltransferase family 4 protein [Chitinophagaceae bacterium]